MDGLLTKKMDKNCICIKRICETVGKNSVNIVTVSNGRRSIKDCRVVWVIGRQHPGETSSSYMV
jgi:hypothetical protein